MGINYLYRTILGQYCKTLIIHEIDTWLCIYQYQSIIDNGVFWRRLFMFSFAAKKLNPFVLLAIAGLSLVWVVEGSAESTPPSVQTAHKIDGLPQVILKEGLDLTVEAKESNKKQIPILMFFSMEHCPFCMEVQEDYLKPMLRNAEYDSKVIIRKMRIDSTNTVRDFKGKERDAGDFSDDYNVSMVPTLVLVDAQGNKIAPTIIGIANSHYYSAELDDAIEASTQKMRALAKR